MQYRLHAVLVHHALGSRGNSGHYVVMRRVKTMDKFNQDVQKSCRDHGQSLRLQTVDTEHTGRSDNFSCSEYTCKEGSEDVQTLGQGCATAKTRGLEGMGMCLSVEPSKGDASTVWLRISDAECRQVTVQDVLQAEATMLLYERVE